jgi:hypothetical protein
MIGRKSAIGVSVALLCLSCLVSYRAWVSQVCHDRIITLLGTKQYHPKLQRVLSLGELLHTGEFELCHCNSFGHFQLTWTRKSVATSTIILYFSGDHKNSYQWRTDQSNDVWHSISIPSIRSYLER